MPRKEFGNLARRDVSRGGSPLSVEQVLSGLLKAKGIDKKIAKYKFVSHWAEIVGEDIAKRASPECLRNGALVVRVCNSAWAQELSFQKEIILQRLKKYTPQDEVVKDVVFYVSPIS